MRSGVSTTRPATSPAWRSASDIAPLETGEPVLGQRRPGDARNQEAVAEAGDRERGDHAGQAVWAGRNAMPASPPASRTAPALTRPAPARRPEARADRNGARGGASPAGSSSPPSRRGAANSSRPRSGRRPRGRARPTRAPESRASAALAGPKPRIRPAGRGAARGHGGGATRPSAATTASAAIGACTREDRSRQSNASVSTPPTAGPSAAPNAPATAQRAAPALRVAGASDLARGNEPASSIAPGRDPGCSGKATRAQSEGANAQASDAAAEDDQHPWRVRRTGSNLQACSGRARRRPRRRRRCRT